LGGAELTIPPPLNLQADVRALADRHDFSGVVAVLRRGERIMAFARGSADRANQRPITLDTRLPSRVSSKV